MRKSVTANDAAYDVAFVNTMSAGSLAENGITMNIRNLDKLDLSAEWWDQNVISGLSVANKVYMLTGDISIMPKKTIRVIYFNKLLASDFDIADPYTLINDMAWTLDKMSEIAHTVSDDLNGDSVMNDEDRYGIVFSSNTIGPMLIGAGVTYASKDNDDIPFIDFYDETAQKAWEKITELFYDGNYCRNCDVVPMFTADKGLFASIELHNLQVMRCMITDFGILPNPMLDESQGAYYSTINPNVAAMLVIPMDCPDTERISYVLDVMAAQSKNVLTPAYIETYLKGKMTRDTESEATLNIY